MEINYFCTLFNQAYLSRGLALYQSLHRHCPNFHLFIFPFDQQTHNTLAALNLKGVTLVPLASFESADLLEIRPSRTIAEYCWTCTPAIILYSIENFQLPLCTYLDADLFFFADPTPLITEMGNKSVLITEHRYTPKYDQTRESGIYCVQFMTFKNDPQGMKVLTWWRKACIDWCYARAEDGKFGDQKYLDDWPERFEGVHILQHPGGGIAPWNVQQFNYKLNKNKIIFYHFHQFKMYEDGIFDLGNYQLSQKDREIFYWPYLNQILQVHKLLERENVQSQWDRINLMDNQLHAFWKRIKRTLKGTYNIFQLKNEISRISAAKFGP